MTITPERIAELRLWVGPVAMELLDEIERLRAVIRETHQPGCNRYGTGHAPTCKIHEIKP